MTGLSSPGGAGRARGAVPVREAVLVLAGRAILGEGPVWDVRTKQLWWVDIFARQVHRFDPATGGDAVLPTPGQVGCVGLRPGGGLVAGIEHELALCELTGSAWTVIARLDAEPPENRINDGKADPRGRFVFGTMSSTRTPGTAGLYLADAVGPARRIAAGLTISNGLDWSPAGDVFYLIDSVEKAVRSFPWPEAPGGLAGGRVVVDAGGDGETRLLDGMCIDAEGMLWVAHFGAGRVSRWDPRTGRELERVSVPAPRVTSCAFGGPDLRMLFVTTARTGLDDRQLAAWPLSGSLFGVETGVPGVPAHRFGKE